MEKEYEQQGREKDESFQKDLLIKKFNDIYTDSKYPEVYILLSDYQAIDFDNSAIEKRAREIALRFLTDHIGLT